MMRMSIVVLLIFCSLGCNEKTDDKNFGDVTSANEDTMPPDYENSYTKSIRVTNTRTSGETIKHSKYEPHYFSVHVNGDDFELKTEPGAYFLILNYPSELHAKVRVTEYRGPRNDEPYSPAFCELIRAMPGFGGGDFVRAAYLTTLAVEIPSFLRFNFDRAISKAAEEAAKKDGWIFRTAAAYEIKNAVLRMNGKFNLKFSERAITPLLLRLEEIYAQLKWPIMSGGNGPHSEMRVYSADIMCDLLSGDATITVDYPIKKDDKVIKVIYDFELDL